MDKDFIIGLVIGIGGASLIWRLSNDKKKELEKYNEKEEEESSEFMDALDREFEGMAPDLEINLPTYEMLLNESYNLNLPEDDYRLGIWVTDKGTRIMTQQEKS